MSKNSHKQDLQENQTVLKEESSVYAENNEIKEPLENSSVIQEPVKDKQETLLQKEQEAQLKKLDDIEQTVSKKSSKKSKILNWVFFALNVLVVACILVYQLTKEKVVAPVGLVIHAGPVLLLLLLFVFNILVDSFGMSYLMKRNTGKWRFGLSYKVNAIGRYYDAATPLSTGGQPFQITYLKSRDIPLHTAMSIPLTKMVFQQICWVVLSFICMCISWANPKYNSLVSIASIIGFILGMFMLFAVVFISISKNWGRKLVVGILKLLQKMKLLKSYEKTYDKIMKIIEDYQTVMRQIAKSPKDFIVLFTSYMARMLLVYTFPYLIFSIFHGFEAQMWGDFFVMAVLIDLAASFFPLPGGTGMSELTFSAMFAAYFTGGTLFWALILWRLFSYYYYLLQGISLITYDVFYGNRKYKWLQRKETLVEESKIFKQEQIDKFRLARNKQRKAQNRRFPRSSR